MYSSQVPTSLNSKYSYYTILSDVCKIRFNHLATRLLLTLSVLIASILTFFTKWHISTLEGLLIFPVKFLLLYTAFLIVIITRKNYLHVQFLGHGNVISLIYDQFVSVKFISYQVTYLSSGLLISWALDGVVLNPRYSIPVYYKRLNEWVLNPFIYTVQLLIFDQERLSFRFGFECGKKKGLLNTNLYNSFFKCAILTFVVSIFQPILYFFLSSSLHEGIAAYLESIITSYIVFQLWDFTNIAFNAYLSIGCLHKGKPISSLSSTPMQTLVTGLSSKKLFTKLTAFQDLSYRATSPDINLRLPIYQTRHGSSHIWSNILRECILVIQDYNNNISLFLKSLEARSEDSLKSSRQEVVPPLSYEEVLFGNKPINYSSGFQKSLPGSPPSADNVISQRITLEDNRLHSHDQNPGHLSQFPHSLNSPIFTQQTNILNLGHDIVSFASRILWSFFFPSQTESSNIRPLSFFELWTISKKRQAEKLVTLPNCYAECIIALMGMLINSLDEDSKGSVVSSVAEVLKILERSVGSLGAFVEWDVPDQDEKDPDVISSLYDLAINAFLEIVLKYNQLLKNVYLDDDVVKLSQWVLKMCDE